MADAQPALTDQELAAIEARYDAVRDIDREMTTLRPEEWEALHAFQGAAWTDVPRLLAEVHRLRALLAERSERGG
jgi:hypothetical protein